MQLHVTKPGGIMWHLLAGKKMANLLLLLLCAGFLVAKRTELCWHDRNGGNSGSPKYSLCEVFGSSPGEVVDSDSTSTTSIVWPTTDHSQTTRETPSTEPFGSSSVTPQCHESNQTTINGQIIVWPTTEMGSDAVSYPLCLSESLQIIKRYCDLEWDAPPTCASVQQQINPCPSDLTSINARYCYTKIKKTKFPPACPYPRPLGWEEYVNLDLFGGQPVWKSLRRITSAQHGIDIFRYNELTDKYNTPFEICTQSCLTLFYKDTFLDKECQVYHNSTHIEAVSCDAEYSAICMYDALPYQKSSLCEQTYSKCRQGDYKANSICFCETTTPLVGENVLADFVLPYQSLIFTKTTCRFGLRNTLVDSPIPFLWSNANLHINYTNWAPHVDFSNENGLVTSDGWVLSNDSSDCHIYYLDIPIKEGKLLLRIDESHQQSYKLEITNYKHFLSRNNSAPLVYCFTDADAKSLIYQVTNITEIVPTPEADDYVMKFSAINVDQSGPGHYWCQAFLYPDLTVVTSDAIMIENPIAEYVVLFKLNNYEEKLSFYPLTPENFETLQNLFRNELPSTVSFFPRIFKINDIDEARKEITITFHLTSDEGSNTEDEYEYLKSLCMEQSMFEFLDFRNVHDCPNSITHHRGQTLVWPRMPWNESTYPVLNGEIAGHCVTANATLIHRTCMGNFIDGDYWSDINDECQFYPSSHLTERLVKISYQTDDDEGLSELLDISNEYESFTTLDFVLAANFIKDVTSMTKPDLDLIAEIVSNLMEISRAVLLSAQLNFKSTDVLLKAVDVALEKGDFGEWKKPKFAIKSVDISEGILGFQLQNCVNYSNCDLEPIMDSSVLYNHTFIVTENVDIAISLSQELYEQIISYSHSNESYIPKLVVSVYYGSQLFVELENSKASNLVIGALLPDFIAPFKGPVSIYYYTNLKSHSLDLNCSYWAFDDKCSGSWTMETTDELSDAVACEFYHMTHFGIPSIIAANPKESTFISQMCVPDDEVSKKCFTDDDDELGECNNLINIMMSTALDTFCLTTDLTMIPTNCFQNVTSNDCSDDVHQLSTTMGSILEHIEDVTDDTYDSILSLLLSMTASYDNITDFELLYVASFLKIVSNQTMNMTKLAGIVNNLMKVPRSVMYSAQLNYRVVDLLLNTIEQALTNDEECGEWTSELFVIKCLEIDEEHLGVFLKNCSENLNNGYCNLELVGHNNIPPDNESFSSETVYAVIALSDVLFDQIVSYSKTNSSYTPKLMIAIYSTSTLFIDVGATTPLSNFVFGILLPGFSEEFQGPVRIYYLKDGDSIQYNCSYWKFDEIDYGTWIVESNLLNDQDQATVCEFFHLTNFIVPITKVLHGPTGIDVEKHLLEKNLSLSTFLFHSQCNVDDIMADLCALPYSFTNSHQSIFNDITTWSLAPDFSEARQSSLEKTSASMLFKNADHHQGNSICSSLFALNISRIEPLEIIENLEALADLISACMMDINKYQFREAQIGANSILYNLDEILKHVNVTGQVKRRNILFVTISKEDIKDFQGLLITHDRDVLCINHRNFNDNTDEIEVSVILSPELRMHIAEIQSPIIFAIFYNTMLFPVLNQPAVVRLPIIEVLIPSNLNGNLKGEILIEYNNNPYKGKCSYWDHYDVSYNAITKSGYWKEESDAVINGNVVTCKFQHVTHFALVENLQNITTDLEQILASNLTGLEKLKQVDSITASNHDNLVPIDIYLISQIITNSLTEGPIPNVITKIISSLFMVPRSVLKESQQHHSATDIILYAVDEMAGMVDDFDIHLNNFSLIVKNFDQTNLTGLVLSGCNEYKCNVDIILDEFVNISDYTANESVSAMVIFSEQLVTQIRQYSSSKVAISVYYSDILFNELSNTRKTTKIFGITFPGLTNNVDALNGPVSVVYKTVKTDAVANTSDSSQCAYWHYKANPTGNIDNATLGAWKTEPHKQMENAMAICSYSHLTHFGMLLANNDDYDNDPILDLVTDIGCILSLFGVLLILVTAMLFKKWRQNTGNKILVNFSIAISIKIITLYVSAYIKNHSWGIACTITGIALHYAILSECAWMLTVAILQFKRFVEVLGGPPKYVLVKALVCGWLFPLIPVVCVISIDPHNYEQGVANLCYPSTLGLYLGVWLPVLLILSINCIIFTFIIYNVFHKKTEFIDTSNHEMFFQWRLALLLFFMLGLNWTFGFLGQIKSDLLFTYLYSVTASLQGFVLFLFFIVFNKNTRFLYSQAIKQWFYARGIFKVWQSKSSKSHHAKY